MNIGAMASLTHLSIAHNLLKWLPIDVVLQDCPVAKRCATCSAEAFTGACATYATLGAGPVWWVCGRVGECVCIRARVSHRCFELNSLAGVLPSAVFSRLCDGQFGRPSATRKLAVDRFVHTDCAAACDAEHLRSNSALVDHTGFRAPAVDRNCMASACAVVSCGVLWCALRSFVSYMRLCAGR